MGVPESKTEDDTDYDRYKESSSVMTMFKESESKDLEKTKQALFELSDLLNLCQKKIQEQSEMTQQSKMSIKLCSLCEFSSVGV